MKLLKYNGGMTNAATSHDYCPFFISQLLRNILPETLPALAEILATGGNRGMKNFIVSGMWF